MTAPLRMAALWVAAMVSSGCSVGPSAVSHGRSTYNEVINRTEDQQILSMIVRQRYDETFGMLVVSSVTASLRVGASIGVNVGIGPSSGYEGNLVPLSTGAAYEENPTISYVPLGGERFLERMLAPVTAEQALLLIRMSTSEIEVLPFLVRRANGLVNPRYSSRPATREFDRFVDLYVELREAGKLDVVRAGDGEFALLLHDHTEEQREEVAELLRTLGVRIAGDLAASITVPLRFFVGAPRVDGVDFEMPSALEVIDAAAAGVDVPGEHLVAGIARPAAAHQGLITIHSSPGRPDTASVAVEHRGWWFFVDGRDTRSKQGFMILRTLIGMRLDAAALGQGVPTLTVPVSR